ncbi:hypothetical protein HCC61_06150 [Streptomyces sp. HNM0575]|uniref:hypothetical protein n=1 Tax=Streptomyces sp. HNM0575 TaxID=2716338 RepID=UPI00145C5AB5|nr:hypothetical protein [Streptomyces sp. HNM0575]NLU72267.1 hypothetical protein [Streptomyces sp. HNM0575]
MSESVRDRGGGPVEWSGGVAAPGMMIGGAVLVLVFLVLAPIYPDEVFAHVGALVGAVALFALGSVRVHVNAFGVTVRSAIIPPMRRRIPLARIAEASAKRARPLQLGGWGYRWRPRRTAISLRGGDALFLRLNSGREFVITIDDADRAAQAVNSQLARDGREKG